MMRVLLVVVLSSLLLILPTQPALACSGGTPDEFSNFSIDYLINWSEYFVKATIVAADDASQNFILQVISSQKSMPPKQLVLAVTSPFTTRRGYRFASHV